MIDDRKLKRANRIKRIPKRSVIEIISEESGLLYAEYKVELSYLRILKIRPRKKIKSMERLKCQ